MSRLILVRHGQASFLTDDYDQLSEKGRIQAEKLGRYWSVSPGATFDCVIYGPAKRHRQTGEIAGDVLRRGGGGWPRALVMPEFDEYQAFDLMRLALPALLEKDPEMRAWETAFRNEKDAAEAARWFEKLFQRVTRSWANGEIAAGGVEPWDEFCARVERGLDQVRNLAGSKSSTVVFSSGGPIAAAARMALGLTPGKALELSWASRNASYSEFLFSPGRFSLSSFNVHPHLDLPELLTYR